MYRMKAICCEHAQKILYKTLARKNIYILEEKRLMKGDGYGKTKKRKSIYFTGYMYYMNKSVMGEKRAKFQASNFFKWEKIGY